MTISNLYILLLIIFVLFIAKQIWQYKKRLGEYKEAERTTEQAMLRQVERKDKQGIEWQLKRQHHANDWAREEISRRGLDKEDTRSTAQQWVELIIFGIIPIICLIVALNYPKYAKKRALELAQEPSNLIHGCMYYAGRFGRNDTPYIIIEKQEIARFRVMVENSPAYQKFRTHYFKKNHCYPIKYIKITNPVFAEKIYVYDIDL